MNTIQQQWEGFKKNVVPNDAPEIQVSEMRIAFFGGASALLALTTEISYHSEDAGVEMLEGLHDECRRFADTGKN